VPAPRHCRAMSCKVPVYAPKIMCDEHWSLVPTEQKNKILNTFVRGVHVDNQPTSDFTKAINAAIKTLVLIEAQRKQEIAKSKRSA
jgi:hypothetical protein